MVNSEPDVVADVDSAEIRMLVSAVVDTDLDAVEVLVAALTVEASVSGRSWPLMAVVFVELVAWRAMNRRMLRLRKTGRRRVVCSSWMWRRDCDLD